MKDALFLIESGKPLEMVRQHIQDMTRVRNQNAAFAKELGVENIWTDRMNGTLSAVEFPGAIHPDFSKPKRRNGGSYPKKGTEWYKRLTNAEGTRNAASWIAEEFGIPLSVSYKSEHSSGWSAIGRPLTECGFLFLGENGPYALWAPDVPAIVAERAEGRVIDEPAASFQFNIQGVRRIPHEEWELMVAQYKFDKLKEKQNAS